MDVLDIFISHRQLLRQNRGADAQPDPAHEYPPELLRRLYGALARAAGRNRGAADARGALAR